MAPTPLPGAPSAPSPGAVSPQPLVVSSAQAAPSGQTAAALTNFPVPGGAVRRSFSSSRAKSTWQERGTYTAAATPDAVLGTYAPQIAVAGWNETYRAQSGDAAAHTLQSTVDFLNGATKAHLIVAQNAQGVTTIAVTVTTIYPGNSAPALSALATAAPATGAATSASDRGTADPADFPRLPGSIRSSFTTSRQTTFSQEVATYTARCAPASADAFYGQNLPGAGWDELTRDENLNDATKGDQISAKWQNGSRTAAIALSGSTAGGIDVRVTITTQTAAP